MERVRLGRTNLMVARLGLGGIPIQHVPEEQAMAVVREAVELGVQVMDTSRQYGRSEEWIGKALKEVDRPVVLSSKSPVRTDQIYREVQESRRKLQREKIEIYRLHNVSNWTDYERVTGPGGGLEGLQRARQEGLIDFIGISSHSLGVLKRAIEDGFFDVIMACYSFLEWEAAQEVFPLAREKDIGILAMKTFSGGVIEEIGPALRFVLSSPGIVPIPGSGTVETVRENWRIFMEGGGVTEADRERIGEIRKKFDRQFCRRCEYCRPCPQDIHIPSAMGLNNFIRRLGESILETGWITELVAKARNCAECGECLPRCPYQLPIPEIIKRNLALYDSLPRAPKRWGRKK
ncbi:MAG: aldo/keto reductase [Deltaproteobacteria bacterium]|nr:aldo/keto reductase [Deltaproteobacteria bacterium]